MAKGIRVNQLAKELGVESKAILAKFRQEGLAEKVPNHMSVLSIGLSETVRGWFSGGGWVDTAVELALSAVATALRSDVASRNSTGILDIDLCKLIKSDEVQDFTPGAILKGKISNVVGDDFVVELGVKSEGVLERAEFNAPETVKVGDEFFVLLEDVEGDTGLVKISKRRADRIIEEAIMKSKKKLGDTSHQANTAKDANLQVPRSSGAAVQPNPSGGIADRNAAVTGRAQTEEPRAAKGVVIDGTNVICADNGKPKIENLLTILLYLVREGYEMLCIFDANTMYRLRDEQGNSCAKLYEQLLHDHGEYFRACTGGKRADPFILKEAQRRNAGIVSNDRFRDPEYRDKFPWLVDESRLIKVNVFPKVIYLDETDLEIISDPIVAMRDLRGLLNARKGK